MPADVREITVPTRQGYDRWSEVYDRDGNPLLALEEPEVIRMMGEVRGLTIADVGTGTGRHALRFASAGARVVGVDFSLAMMERARAKPNADRIAFICADCLRLPCRARPSTESFPAWLRSTFPPWSLISRNSAESAAGAASSL
jgi:SAM-dependent methyltransferase